MRLTKYGHSCLLVEEGSARLLLDPGVYSTGFERLAGLTAILITHQHPDHVDMDRLPTLVAANAGADLYADEGTAAQLAERGLPVRAVHEGDVLDVGCRVRIAGRVHAVIHPDIPGIPNVGYLVEERFFHPGDSFTRPDADLGVLGVPTSAPWLKLSEAVDYLRAVRPRVGVPIHEAVLARPQMNYALLERLAPAGTEVRVIDDGQPVDF